MKPSLKFCVALLAVAGAASTAKAAVDNTYYAPPVPLPQMSTTQPNQGTLTNTYSSGAFVDTYTFQLGGTSTANTVTTNLTGADLGIDEDLNIDNLSLSLTKNGTTIAPTATNGANLSYANLVAGSDYAFVVTGDVTGSDGGSYQVGYNVTATPIPGSVVLFGSALLGLAGLGRRSMKTCAA